MIVMDIFEVLGAEHARVAAVCDALDAFTKSIGEGAGDVDMHEAIRFVTFFRAFSDGLHHEREETVLWPFLKLVGFSITHGPLAHLHDEHIQQGKLVLELEKALSQKGPWRLGERKRLEQSAHALTTFERKHMSHERELLFPIAKKDLAGKLQEIEVALKAFNQTRALRWDGPWLEALAEDLIVAHPA